MDLSLADRIIKYIENHHPISYTKIVNVAAGKGFNESQVLQALDKVGRNKSITTKTRGTEIWYDLIVIAPPKPAPTHTAWVTNNYPWPPPGWTEAFPEIDMSHIFMTRDEAKEYKAQASGRPVFMQNKYAR